MNTIVATFQETQELAKKVARSLKAKHSEIITKQFPDGESYIKLQVNPKNKTVIFIVSFAHEPNKKIIEAILAAQTARDYKAKRIILVATYLPYMRQDKRFNDYESLSAQTIIPLLAGYFDEIFAIDPHLHRIK